MTWLEKPDELRNGACVGHHRLFFAPYAERPTNRIVRERKALALCAQCTVKAACKAWADRNKETTGIWAGEIRTGSTASDTPAEIKRRRATKEQKATARCGTERGYAQHRRDGTPLCDACRRSRENALANKAAAARRRRIQANAELASIRQAS